MLDDIAPTQDPGAKQDGDFAAEAAVLALGNAEAAVAPPLFSPTC